VPESFGALIRHVQGWFAEKGGRVPDESTMKRRLRDVWAMFGSPHPRPPCTVPGAGCQRAVKEG
jgi:hypothetical protein